MRKGIIHQCQCPQCKQGDPSSTTSLHAHINLFLSTLDERQRRLYAGLESQHLGHGGDQQIALITGMSVHTIAQGRRELAQSHLDARIRKPGAGRPAVEKQDPSILPALEQMLEDATAGDPESALKWKRPSLRHLSDALHPEHAASAATVRRLLRALGYSPKGNRKRLGKSNPQRDEQFRYLLSQKALFLQHHWPVLSIDAKKRELIGWFKNPGTIWCREPNGTSAPSDLFSFSCAASLVDWRDTPESVPSAPASSPKRHPPRLARRWSWPRSTHLPRLRPA
jgi:hypothetical protein